MRSSSNLFHSARQHLMKGVSLLRLMRHITLLVGLLLLWLAYDHQMKLNHPNAVDVKTIGVVVDKKLESRRKRLGKNRAGKRKITREMLVVYKVDLASYDDDDAKTVEKIKAKQLENFESDDVDLQSKMGRVERWLAQGDYPLGTYIFDEMNVSSTGYASAAVRDKISVFFRSNRPWEASLNLVEEREDIRPTFYWGIFILLLSLIGFGKSFFERRKERLFQ